MSAGTGQRADVQGLRALAVGTVVLAHAGVPGLAGGFVGVDVFFVVSGFLITQLLLREVARTGRVSLLGFYARRARRILPAATVVLLAIAVATVLWLGPVRAPSALDDVVWAALLASNVRFALEDSDYFALGDPSPVRHYWSLAVEEQFYLAWPLLLLLVALWCRRRGRSVTGPVAAVLAVVCVASLAWSVHRTAVQPVWAYYSTFARAFELGLGALGAVLLTTRWAPGRALREGGAVAGLALVAVAVVGYGPGTPFPGWQAAVPVVGTALLLVLGPGTYVGRALSVRPARVLGDWSYSVYLWHWPLLVVPVAWLGRDLWPLESAALVLLTLVLSWASYTWVEQPFRRPGTWAPPRRALALYPLSVVLLVTGALGGAAVVDRREEARDEPAIALTAPWTDEWRTDDPTVALVRASLAASRRGGPIPGPSRPPLTGLLESRAGLGDCDYADNDVRGLCPRGDPTGDRTLVLVGNSHARHWIPAVERLARADGWRAYYLVKARCQAGFLEPAGNEREGCRDFEDWVAQRLADLRPDLVVASSAVGGESAVRSVGDLLARLRPLTPRLVWIDDVPRLRRDPTRCLGSRHAGLRTCLGKQRAAQARLVERTRVVARAAGAETISTRRWLCVSRACPIVVGDVITYRDSEHLTNEYSALLAPDLARALGLPARVQ